MNLQEYLGAANRTLSDHGFQLNLIHAKYGLVTELGELVDCIKRQQFYGLPFNAHNFLEELGDIAWYAHIAIKYEYEQARTKTVSGLDLASDLNSIQVTHSEEADSLSVAETVFVDYYDTWVQGSELESVGDEAMSLLNLVTGNNDILTTSLICMGFVIRQANRYLADAFDEYEVVAKHGASSPFELILTSNILKLSKRYPNGDYNMLNAEIRNLAGESDALVTYLKPYLEIVSNSYNNAVGRLSRLHM